VSAIAVVGITYMRRKGLAQSDSAIAVMMAMGFSLGMIVISLANGFNVELFSYLFGSILTIDSTDLTVLVLLALVIIGFMVFFYKEMLAITFDEDGARLQGIPVQAMALAFNILVAVTIALSIKVIGIILVVALMVLPGLTALQLKRSFKTTLIASTVFGVCRRGAGDRALRALSGLHQRGDRVLRQPGYSCSWRLSAPGLSHCLPGGHHLKKST
jgi:zinc transport system permease protein